VEATIVRELPDLERRQQRVAGRHDPMSAAEIAEVPYERALRKPLPFLLSHPMVMALVSAFLIIALWLPSLRH
jgi:hypothetical protein